MQAVLSMVLRDWVRGLHLIQRWSQFLNGQWSIEGAIEGGRRFESRG